MSTCSMTITMSASTADSLDFLALMKEVCEDSQICFVDMARRIQSRHWVGGGLATGEACVTCGALEHYWLLSELQPQLPVRGRFARDISVDLTASRTVVSVSFEMHGWSGDESSTSALLLLSEHFGNATFRIIESENNFEVRGGCIPEDLAVPV